VRRDCRGEAARGSRHRTNPPKILSKIHLPKLSLSMPSLPIFLLRLLSHAGMAVAFPSGADHRYGRRMLTISPIASSFDASTHGCDRIAQENRV